MNERFINVKVDREERPDLDSLYMDAVVAMTGHGGWPMTVFLTPLGEPFLGGTYFPPEPRHGLPAFRQLLVAVSDAYRERREDVAREAGALVDALQESASISPSADPLTESLLGEATRGLAREFDPEWGGFGRAPKFPPASSLEFLLRRHGSAGDEEALAMVTRTLDGMAAGGMYDLLGGGCSSAASCGRSRSATTRRLPPGTASRSPRSQRRGAGSTARTSSRPAESWRSSCSGRSPTRVGACTAAGVPAGLAIPATWRTT